MRTYRLQNSVPQGRLNLAQDAVLGRDLRDEESRRDDWKFPAEIQDHVSIGSPVVPTGLFDSVCHPHLSKLDLKNAPVQQLSLCNRHPFLCHPERTRISYLTALTSATYVVLPKENHMQLIEAATLDRKSGEADFPLPRRAVGPERTRIFLPRSTRNDRVCGFQ